ncbi:MAG TPA: SDR family oxidoreductase [Mycobacteriales bacterium]|nr:SDR family oxidoreductase [Mycobacteriales bacterium]
MKIVVIGGTGLIGRQMVPILRGRGHDVLPASPSSGVDTITGAGLDEALAGAQVVVDLANSPSFEDQAVMEFFRTSGTNLLAAEAEAGVGHHVALTIVGADRVPDSGYMRAKIAQEQVIEAAEVPYTIVRSTQFLEFMRAAADAGAEGGTVRVPAAALQPIAAADVAAAVSEVALAGPANGIIEIAGPDRIPFPDIIRDVLAAAGDPRPVIGDEHARYFGTELTDDSITAGPDARLGPTTLAQWLEAGPAR